MTAKLCIIKTTHRATVWNPALVTTRVVKPPVARGHRKWLDIGDAADRRRSAAPSGLSHSSVSQAKPAAAIAKGERL